MSDTEEETTQQSTPEGLEEAIDSATEAVAIQTRELEELAGSDGEGASVGLGGLMDVPVTVTVEVGRASLPLAKLVNMTPGSLLELEREAHEPADVLVNGKVVARGEIVTIDNRYGVRITSVEH
ncbi:MAG: flagellar motor switch protein FliN/FliY [Planctomycetota bacterium]|jgi:flagellar motor switch protein FliN/FliY